MTLQAEAPVHIRQAAVRLAVAVENFNTSMGDALKGELETGI